MEIDRALIEKHPGTVLACWAQYGIAAMIGSSPEGIAAMRKVKEMLPNRADLTSLDLSRVVLGDWCGRYLTGRQDVLDAAEFLGLDRNDPKQKAEALAIVAAHFARTQSLEKAKPILDRLLSECPGEREEVEWAKVEAAIACIDGRECTEEYQHLAVGYLTPYSVLTLSEDDEAAKACLALARYYKRNGRVDEAVAVLKHAVERHSNTSRGAQVLYEYGSALDKQGKSEDAIKALEEMIARKPLSTYAAAAGTLIEKIRSKAATQTASLDELIKEADANFDPKWQVLASVPRDGSLDDPVMVARQAVALAREDKVELALELLDDYGSRYGVRSDDLWTSKAETTLCSLRAGARVGRISDEAVFVLAPLIRLPGTDSQQVTQAGGHLLARAIEIVQDALTRMPPGGETARWAKWIGNGCMFLGRYHEAIRAFGVVRRSGYAPDDMKAEATYLAGICYRAIGYQRSTEACMLQLIKQYPTSPWAAKAALVLDEGMAAR
jgi:tetratricopeptide (TPR) repeat protein